MNKQETGYLFNVREARLNMNMSMQNILHMRNAGNISAEDYRLWEKVLRFMNGETAYVHKSFSNPNVYLFLGLKNEIKNKELFYLLEQDSRKGSYYNDRKRFEKDWNSGEYMLDGNIVMGLANIIFEE